MSATNRGSQRNKWDYYVTPVATVNDFLLAFRHLEPAFNISRSLILDPCAGGDKKNEMTYPYVLRQMGGKRIITVDIRKDSKAHFKRDYLKCVCSRKYDAVFTNPPFDLGIEFINKALFDVRDGGFVGMLLRLNFLGSIRRRPFWQANMPKWIIVHAKRPSFENGGTDSVEYAHIIWQKGYKPPHCRLIVV